MIEIFTTCGMKGTLEITNKKSISLQYTGLQEEWSRTEQQSTSTQGSLFHDGKVVRFTLESNDTSEIMQAAQQAASLLYLLDADEHTQYADTHPSGDFDDRTFTMAEVHQEHIQALMRERIASCNAIESLKMEQYHIQIEEVDSYFYNSSGDILHEISSTYSTEFEIVSIAEGNGQSVANGRTTNELILDDTDLLRESIQHIQDKMNPGIAQFGAGKGYVRFSQDCSEEFIDFLMDSLIGGGVFEKQSPYQVGDMHQKIAGCITVESLPVLPGSPYVYHFDAEGIAVEPLTIIHQGILNHWFVGTKYAKKLNVIPCGQSQQRNIRVTGVYNADLEIQACVEITFLKGFHTIDALSGNFALEAEGYQLENGVRKKFITHFSISGNLKQLFASIVSVGKNGRPYQSNSIPTLLVEGLQLHV